MAAAFFFVVSSPFQKKFNWAKVAKKIALFAQLKSKNVSD